MAITNRDRVTKALDLLKAGLAPFVEREMTSSFGAEAEAEARRVLGDDRINSKRPIAEWDVAPLLRVLSEQWNGVFRRILGRAEESLVNELRQHRNSWAHQGNVTSDDAYRVLDSAGRLLVAISAPQSDEIEKAKLELLRLRFDEQIRSEKRKVASTAIESSSTLKPWREIATPHKDVASGRYQQAEFAADLWQVHLGEGSEEYRNPVEFYRRTYLTQSLEGLLTGAVRRLTGRGGDPVVQLQTNFGGGKTHSMLALFHLFSAASPADLLGIDAVMKAAGATELPSVRRIVLVGNKVSPGNPSQKPDGTIVRTLWGELAWQLGGKTAFDRIAADDQHATSPGDALRELFKEYGPCLILIDEWVAYARQLHDQSDLPAGSFETQFSFAQALTESAKLVDNCLLVISLPASDTSGSPHAQANDVEVGGQRGREALERLRNVVGRVEATWRPASAEEGFEIVRRRLFEPMTDPAQFKDRDVIARAFGDLYRSQQSEFPPECQQPDYENRIKAAYPIHPEIFDRLYNDWSTLVKFQRTRGVLRLMAAVIHSLWEKDDRNPLILPANISIDDPRVQFELTRYLSDNWVPVIEKDVDGPNSLPLQLDRELASGLGRYSACRRVARTIYLGSAPLTQAAHRGVEDRRVKLGCVMPRESPAVFGDALRRLAGAATYLYEDGSRYWYSTQPTVTKLAEDRAEQLARSPDKIVQEIERRVTADLKIKGDFSRIHPLPPSGIEVQDDVDARLVVLRTDHLFSREPGNAAEKEATAILEFRGNQPRLYRNTLVFLAADKTRFQDLASATRRYLAWKSILDEGEMLNLDRQQARQAENQKKNADATVEAQIPETYQWLLVPFQKDNKPDAAIQWQPVQVSGKESLAVNAGVKAIKGSHLAMGLGANALRLELDRVPLWRGDHVPVKQLVEDFARYPYLQRLKNPEGILVAAIREGVAFATWEKDSFAFAESYDEVAGRYRALRAGQDLSTETILGGLLVRSEVAMQQIEAERKPASADPPKSAEATPTPGQHIAVVAGPTQPPTAAARPTRYHGSVKVDATRVGRDASRIAEEVIAHLSSLVGTKVTVTLEIEAEIPGGAPDHVVRTVTENGRTLKFTSQGFEKE